MEVVYGRFDHPDAAAGFRDRVLELGFQGTEVMFDGCNRQVVLEGVPSVEIAHELQAEAATVDLHLTVELDPDG